MTDQTLSLAYGLMYYTLSKGSGLVLVTPITEGGPGSLEQALETGHVRTVTRAASALGNRLMHCLALEFSPLVALKTGRFGKTGCNRTNGQDNYQQQC